MKDQERDTSFEVLDLPAKGAASPVLVPYVRSSSLMPGLSTPAGVTPETVSLTIDGKAVSVPKGTLLIEAAKQASIEIPSFCYYPGLSLQGACRMCLVSIEKMPKLQTACTTVVANGMVVRTDTEEVKNARKAMLEFLLTNHPLDCPVCDKGGECELQDAVFRYGAAETRFLETKLHHEEKKFSSLVYYDWPRCILCYRCIRVCDEGLDVNAYGIAFRGAHSEIIPNRGDHLECEECGMCIDICPVGALTSGTYRYHTRPWEVTYTGTICNHCGDGCKTTLSVRNNVIVRANNRDHSGINGEFLCVKGRFGWDFVNSDQRLTTPLIRRGGKQEPATWEEALALTVDSLKNVLAEHGPESIAVIGSNRTTNEENYLLQRFARTVLGTNNVDHHRTADYSSLVRALTEARTPGRHATMEDIVRASSILLIGGDPTHEHPLLAYQIRQAVRRGARLYVVNSDEIKLRRQAAHYVRVSAGDEAAAVRTLAGAAAGPPAEAEGLQTLGEKVSRESDTVIIFSDRIQGDSAVELVRWGLTLPGQTRFVALGDYANSRGAADMGLMPGALPGYQSIANEEARKHYETAWNASVPATPGQNLRKIISGIDRGEIKALLVFGSNPVKTFKIGESVMGKLNFLFVAELFPTETAQLANVVVPATSFAEKSGTVTNTCGQVQSVKRTMRRAGTRSDLEILVTMARLLGHSWAYRTSEEVLREIVRTVPGYALPLPALLIGRAIATDPQGTVGPPERSDLVFSSRDSLFTSGTVSRYSWALNSVEEAKRPHGHIF
ncbi:MAG TPA: NADH-quinone oxidoreductase subunit NuoG [Candidatus Sulfotelmatobacter sp.]|nr:NADH-quinone oxidoreductase subunit NuoG [Candidatus Sulfotelmatobacter sp.]